MLVGTALGFLGIASLGSTLSAPAPAGPGLQVPAGPRASPDILVHLLVALAVIVLFAGLVGFLFRKLEEPPVIGEVLAGIMLGPSLLGQVAPDLYARLLPPAVAPFLSAIAQVGIIIFMFLVGMELDLRLLRQRSHAAVMVSHASIIVPFLLGALLALWLYPRLSSSEVPFTVFALFMGLSMSVTAFPVLARILTDRGIQRTELGVLALSCAAVDDATAWCLLAFLVSYVQARAGSALWTAALAVAYVAAMFLVLRPLAARWARAQEAEGVTHRTLTVVCVAMLLSALVTESIGIHAIFGAFLLGVMVPPDSRVARELKEKLEGLVLVLLLPAYFAFTGMRTQIGLVQGAEQWLLCAVIVLVASAGKFGGTFLAARSTGSAPREAAALGILMNTRGLMELVVLNIGLDLKVISPTLFAMMVLMALITTVATSPVLHAITRTGSTAPDRRSRA
jgi:Kef-type K+ transport system membrane component KefB